MPEFYGAIAKYDSLYIKWSNGSYTFKKGDLESAWKFAAHIYMAIINKDSIFYFNQSKQQWLPLLAHPNEQTQCKIVLKDYFTLVSKY